MTGGRYASGGVTARAAPRAAAGRRQLLLPRAAGALRRQRVRDRRRARGRVFRGGPWRRIRSPRAIRNFLRGGPAANLQTETATRRQIVGRRFKLPEGRGRLLARAEGVGVNPSFVWRPCLSRCPPACPSGSSRSATVSTTCGSTACCSSAFTTPAPACSSPYGESWISETGYPKIVVYRRPGGCT